MKKLLLLIFLASVSIAASGQFRVGGFAGYGSEIRQWGAGVNGEIFFSEKMSIAPNLLFFFPETHDDITFTFWEINANFQYYFLQDDAIDVYGLLGLNIMTSQIKDAGNILPRPEDSKSELGANLGLGMNINLQSRMIPFIELRYVGGGVDQTVLQAGVKLPLDKN